MQRKNKILLHSVFWAVMLIVIGLESVPLIGKMAVNDILLDNIIYGFSFISLFYLYYYFISEKHLSKKNYSVLIIAGLLFTLAYTVPVTFIFTYAMYPKIYQMNGKEFLFEFRTFYFRILETNFVFAMSGSLLKVAMLWYESVMKQKETEKQFVSNELALLRSQINPQFLFNALTNIKSLIEPQPEKAIKSIENLSEIMSYMLYETSAEKVLLDSEIEYINNYLKLQRVMLKQDSVKFDINGNTNGVLVPPMIFMPILEYVFSSCDFSSFAYSGESPVIVVNLSIDENFISFRIIHQIQKNANLKITDNKFSMDSIVRCLDLQFGRHKYTLKTGTEKDNRFVTLQINLT